MAQFTGIPSAECLDNTEERRTTSQGYGRDRHNMRIIFIGGALDEGLSVTEIARRLGVSRQLVQRYAHEARSGEQPEDSNHGRSSDR